MELKFGKFKGKSIEEVSNSEEGVNYLNWLRKNTDPNDPKFGKNNQALIAEIKKHTESKSFYIKDNSQLPKESAKGNSITLETLDKKLDLIIRALELIGQSGFPE